MHRFKLFIAFYRSTLLLSLSFALTVAVLASALGFFSVFGVAFMTGGWMLSLYYKEVTFKNQYLYYHNMGIRKLWIVGYTIIANLLIGAICLFYGYA